MNLSTNAPHPRKVSIKNNSGINRTIEKVKDKAAEGIGGLMIHIRDTDQEQLTEKKRKAPKGFQGGMNASKHASLTQSFQSNSHLRFTRPVASRRVNPPG